MLWKQLYEGEFLEICFQSKCVWIIIKKKNWRRNHRILKGFCTQIAYKNVCNCLLCFKEKKVENCNKWIMKMVYLNLKKERESTQDYPSSDLQAKSLTLIHKILK